jgi:radical SAM superfamily enzyme YgiQ (UPF0313 family)
MAKIAFVAVGADNVSVEVLSQQLKNNGHTTMLAFERALFNDQMYYTVGWLAKLLNREKTLANEIRDFQPDLVAFTVLVDTFKWSCQFAEQLTDLIDTPILFGGVHAITSPEIVLSKDVVDIVCVGEGQEAIVKLANSIDEGEIDYSIKNLWFKKNDEFIRNSRHPNLDVVDNLPWPDKEIIRNRWNIRDYYLTVTNYGCIEKCTFCQQSFYEKQGKVFNLGRFYREKSPGAVLNELHDAKSKYGIRYVDIKNNVLTASPRWYREFLPRYKLEVGVPFRIMGHPRQMNEEYCRLLKEAGCDHIQMGVESLNEEIKKNVIDRHDENKHVYAAVENMERAGLRYSLDFIFGLPGQTEDELQEGARLVATAKNCIRASVFWLQYLPGVGLTENAFHSNRLSQLDIENIEKGDQDHYMSFGSIEDEKQKELLNNYMLLFRLAPITHKKIIEFILDRKLQRWFGRMPQTLIIVIVDVLVTFIRRDYWSMYAIKSVYWEIMSRFDKNFFDKINTPREQKQVSDLT